VILQPGGEIREDSLATDLVEDFVPEALVEMECLVLAAESAEHGPSGGRVGHGVGVADEEERRQGDVGRPLSHALLDLLDLEKPTRRRGVEHQRIVDVGRHHLFVAGKGRGVEAAVERQRRQNVGGHRAEDAFRGRDSQGRGEERAADDETAEVMGPVHHEVESNEAAEAVAEEKAGRDRRVLRHRRFEEALEVVTVVGKPFDVPTTPPRLAMTSEVDQMALEACSPEHFYELPIATSVLGVSVDDHDAACGVF